MSHVTDERADRPLGPSLRDWLDRSIEELPDGAELPPSIRSDVLGRLPATPQRRRWWPLRWHPFGIGATRSADKKEPRPEGRSTSMFTASRIAAAVAVLALAGSLAFVAVPVVDAPATPPAAPAEQLDPGAFADFTGTMTCPALPYPYGVTTWTDWGSSVTGEYWDCQVEVDDQRISGTSATIHSYYKYDHRPAYGIRVTSGVISNDGGSWLEQGGWGFGRPSDRSIVHVEHFRGAGGYEGLSALLVLSIDDDAQVFDVDGVIFPGDLPEAPELTTSPATIAD